MERRELAGIVTAISLSITLAGCDKTETAAKKLMKEGRWVVTEISVGTTMVDKLPKWAIHTCENAVGCSGTWEHPVGTTAGFQWEFSNFSGTFSFYPDQLTSETVSMAYSQCFNFSGEYNVIKSKRDSFHFESTQTAGYPGKMVTIRLENE